MTTRPVKGAGGRNTMDWAAVFSEEPAHTCLYATKRHLPHANRETSQNSGPQNVVKTTKKGHERAINDTGEHGLTGSSALILGIFPSKDLAKTSAQKR